jgi:hypothetical protein
MGRKNLIPRVVLAVVTTACGGESSPSTAPTVSIEDGVRVVENHAPAWGEGEAWQIAAEPTLTIGADIGEEWQMLTYPEADRLSNGRIVVRDRMARMIRWYLPDGTHLASDGGEGEGPGEFASVWNLEVAPDDHVIVYDPQLQRHTRFDERADLVGTLRLEDHEMPYWSGRVIGMFRDGSLLVRAGRQLTARSWLDLPENTIGWYTDGLFRYDPEGGSPRLLGEFEAFESTSREGQNIAFQAMGQFAPHRDGFCHANAREFEIRCYDTEGALVRRIRWPGEPTPISEQDRERYIEKSRENVGNRSDGERWIRETVWPETTPVLHALLVDDLGNIWAERHIGLLHTYPVNMGTGLFIPDASPWEVFDPDGTWLGRIDLPPGRAPQRIGDDWILLAGEDDAGVAHVWLYDLIKP